MNHYPITVVLDRYSGAYSGGEWTAWDEEPDGIPRDVFADDCNCSDFWRGYCGYWKPVGVGSTPEAAVKDLLEKLRI